MTAEEVHAAYADVIQSAGHEYPFRCGRATGFSFLEKPELVIGDKTVLQPGMVLAVDGSVSIGKTFRAQVGDSFVLTGDGYEQITRHPKCLSEIVLQIDHPPKTQHRNLEPASKSGIGNFLKDPVLKGLRF